MERHSRAWADSESWAMIMFSNMSGARSEHLGAARGRLSSALSISANHSFCPYCFISSLESLNLFIPPFGTPAISSTVTGSSSSFPVPFCHSSARRLAFGCSTCYSAGCGVTDRKASKHWTFWNSRLHKIFCTDTSKNIILKLKWKFFLKLSTIYRV